MPMNSTQTVVDRLAIYLAAYKHYVDIRTNANLLDVAIFGESFARDLAEIVFDYHDLVNLNLEKSFPAIDLGSTDAGCAIQVTISGGTSKIVETQEKFFEHGLHNVYPALKFIILTTKQGSYESERIVRSREDFSFDPSTDIYDLNDLFHSVVREANHAKIEAFTNRIERELGDKIRPFLLGMDQTGQCLRRLLDQHDVRPTDAVKVLDRFGITRSTYSNNTSLSNAAGHALIEYIAAQFKVSDDWLDGTTDHIYCGGAGIETDTNWRRSLDGAYDLIERVCSQGEKLSLIVGDESNLRQLDSAKDVVDHRFKGYERFFLVAQRENEFGVDAFRIIISDHLSYKKCRDGLFLLLLAAELYSEKVGKAVYLDVREAPRELIMSCYLGDTFIVDLIHDGHFVRNHKDYFYAHVANGFIATTAVPPRLESWLTENLVEFNARRSNTHSVSVQFPQTKQG